MISKKTNRHALYQFLEQTTKSTQKHNTVYLLAFLLILKKSGNQILCISYISQKILKLKLSKIMLPDAKKLFKIHN